MVWMSLPPRGVAVAAIGLGTGIGIAVSGAEGGSRTPAAASGPYAGPGYTWYRSMMGRYYGGSMMGGSSDAWMMGPGDTDG